MWLSKSRFIAGWQCLKRLYLQVHHPELVGEVGAEAGLAWEKMLHADAGGEERNKLRSYLLAYCKQDTLAMVRLLEVLRAA